MKIYPKKTLEDAWKSTNKFSKEQIMNSSHCGCFCCITVFKPKAKPIKEWISGGKEALCPICGIDSVLSSISGFPVTDKNFLRQMEAYYFGCSYKGRNAEAIRSERYIKFFGDKEHE